MIEDDIIEYALWHKLLFPCDRCQNKDKCGSTLERFKCCSFKSWKLDSCKHGYRCDSCDKPNRQIPLKRKELVRRIKDE